MHVILLHNPQAPEALLACAHEHYVFQSILGVLQIAAVQMGVRSGTFII